MYTNQSALDNMMLGFVKRRKGQAPADQRIKKNNLGEMLNLLYFTITLGLFTTQTPNLVLSNY